LDCDFSTTVVSRGLPFLASSPCTLACFIGSYVAVQLGCWFSPPCLLFWCSRSRSPPCYLTLWFFLVHPAIIQFCLGTSFLCYPSPFHRRCHLEKGPLLYLPSLSLPLGYYLASRGLSLNLAILSPLCLASAFERGISTSAVHLTYRRLLHWHLLLVCYRHWVLDLSQTLAVLPTLYMAPVAG